MRTALKSYELPTEYFVYENRNPAGNHCGDCVVRCLSCALDISWDEALTLLYLKAKTMAYPADSIQVIASVMREFGFLDVTVKPKKGQKRPTMAYLAKLHPDKIVVGQCSKHIMCARDGKVRDIWNSSERALYRYWLRETDPVEGDTPLKRLRAATDRYGLRLDTDNPEEYILSFPTHFGEYSILINPDHIVERLQQELNVTDKDALAYELYSECNSEKRSLTEALCEVTVAFWKLRECIRILSPETGGKQI